VIRGYFFHPLGKTTKQPRRPIRVIHILVKSDHNKLILVISRSNRSHCREHFDKWML